MPASNSSSNLFGPTCHAKGPHASTAGQSSPDLHHIDINITLHMPNSGPAIMYSHNSEASWEAAEAHWPMWPHVLLRYTDPEWYGKKRLRQTLPRASVNGDIHLAVTRHPSCNRLKASLASCLQTHICNESHLHHLPHHRALDKKLVFLCAESAAL